MLRTVLITGASSDLGKSLAMAFRDDFLVLHYHDNKEAVEELAMRLPNRTLIVQADITKEDDVKRMMQDIKEEFNSLDIVINNAAFTQDNLLIDKSYEEFMRVVEVNMGGTFLVSKYASQFDGKNKLKQIINIASTNGIDTETVYSIDYDASKAGIISMTKNLAKSLSPNVRVNCIAPGWIETKSVLEMNPELLENEKEKILMKRFANVNEIAQLVEFVADDKNSYMTGSIIRVDGGVK